METFLDFFIGNMLFCIISLAFLVLVLFIIKEPWAVKGKKQPRNTRKENITVFSFVGFFVLSLGSVIWITAYQNPAYWGYGRAHNFRFATTSADKILLHDELEVSSKNNLASYTRLHVLDAQTGKRLYRGMLGNRVELKYRQGDTLWYISKHALTIFDVRQLKVLLTTDENDLKKIPELSKGIKLEDAQWHAKGKEFLLVTLDGYKYWLNPFTRIARLRTETPPPTSPTQQTPQPITITIDNGDGLPAQKPHNLPTQDRPARYRLKPSPTTHLRDMLVHETTNQPLNASLTFLRGEILHVDTEAKRLIIKHFETTNAKPHEFILVAVDFEGKAIWEKRRKDFACFDFFSFWNKYDFHRSLVLHKQLILTFGGFVYALDLQNGEKIWENRL